MPTPLAHHGHYFTGRPVVGSRRHYRQRQRSPLTRIFIAFFFFVWGIGTVVVLVSRDDARHPSEHDIFPLWQQLQHVVEKNGVVHKDVGAISAANDQIKSRRQQSDPVAVDDDDDDCEIYGCPIYPPEIDKVVVNQTLREALKIAVKDPLASTDSNSKQPSFFATLTHATITRQSNEHEFNQDRSVIFTPFLTLQSPRGTKSFLVAILDGHGVQGHVVAEYAKLQIPKLLASKLNARPCCQSNEWISQQLNDTFIETNLEALAEHALRGGCTASVSLRMGNRLFVANAGDSRTILVKYRYHHDHPDSLVKEGEEYTPIEALLGNWAMGNTTIENGIVHEIPYMSRKDKANLPDERARIQALNGTIHIPPQNPNLSRVIVYSAAARPPESIGLAMSRSIGDWEWKRVGVTAEPIVHVLDLSHYCPHPIDAGADTNIDDNSCSLLLIAASDGLWDLRRPEFYAKRFRESFFPPVNNNNKNENGQHAPFHRHLLEACVNVFWQVAPAQAKWYRDDMSAIIMEANP